MIAYGTEFFIQVSRGNSPSMQIYVTSYTVNSNQGRQTGLLFCFFVLLGILSMLLWKKVSFAELLSDFMNQDIPLLKRSLFHLSYLASGISCSCTQLVGWRYKYVRGGDVCHNTFLTTGITEQNSVCLLKLRVRSGCYDRSLFQ